MMIMKVCLLKFTPIDLAIDECKNDSNYPGKFMDEG